MGLINPGCHLWLEGIGDFPEAGSAQSNYSGAQGDFLEAHLVCQKHFRLLLEVL